MAEATIATSAPLLAPPAARAASFLGHARLISLLTLLSRILGLGREVVAGHYLGTGLVASAFTVAFTIPNLFRKLFGEGALSAAFIPLYSQALKQQSPDQANRFAAAGVNLLCLVLLGITGIGEAILLAILLFNDDLRPDHALTIKLTCIMLPYVLLICGTAFLSGVLQVHRRFGAPAAAPVLLNVIHIVVVLIGASMLGLGVAADPQRIVQMQKTLVYWLAGFVLVAGVLQVMMLWPGLRAVGFRFQPMVGLGSPMIRRMIGLTIPVAMGLGVLQLSVLLDKGIALLLAEGPGATQLELLGHTLGRYPMEAGAAARLNLAQFLYQFPLGVFAIALATAIFPSLSSDALDIDREKFKGVLRTGIQATLWEGLPASVGLILVAEPAVRLLFQHGMIGPADATLIIRSVWFYAAAIWAFSLQQILNRAYYALHDTRTPLVMAIVTLMVNLAVELPLIWVMGEAGMAAGTLVSFSLQAVVMLLILDRKVGGIGLAQCLKPVLKMMLATAIMAGMLLLIRASPFYPAGHSRGIWLAQLLILMTSGAGIYLAACALLGVGDFRNLLPRRKPVSTK